jgi:hypothetical protein
MQTSHSPQDAAQTLRQSLEKSFAQNRALLTEMAHFTRAETLRIAQRNLDHAHHAFTVLESHRDLAGLIGAQQEWMREVMGDYTARGFRYVDMFHSLAQSTRLQAGHAAAEAAAEAEEIAQEIVQESETVMHEAPRAAE